MLITLRSRLHRVGYVISVQGVDSVYVQPTAFDGTELSASPHSELEPNVLRLRDIPSGRAVGCVVFEESVGGIQAAELIAPAGEERWDAWIGSYCGGAVGHGVKKTIDLADYKMPAEIADAIESQRRRGA